MHWIHKELNKEAIKYIFRKQLQQVTVGIQKERNVVWSGYGKVLRILYIFLHNAYQYFPLLHGHIHTHTHVRIHIVHVYFICSL